jgi:arylsulfatase
MKKSTLIYLAAVVSILTQAVWAKDIVHDAEYYIPEAQNGERWAAEDKQLDQRLAELKRTHGRPPNIVYILWDDQQVGAVGNPMIQKNLGYSTPNLNRMAEAGINFTRMYSEPACTPTRAAFLTGRHPVRNGMAVVGMPHEFAGLSAEEVTIAEVLSEAGYATAHYGKGHLGDIEEFLEHEISGSKNVGDWGISSSAFFDSAPLRRGFLTAQARGIG